VRLPIALSNTAAAAPADAAPGMIFINNPRGDYPSANMPLLSISSQNCNSLNISTECHKQLTKIIAITALCTDIVFLSGIRLNTSEVHIQRITKQFLYEGKRSYKLFLKSSKNTRGVGMLIAADLPGEFTDFSRDMEENFLGVTYSSGGGKIRLVSIYGPNDNDIEFYNYLDNYLYKDPTAPIIIGGDWNCTYSCEPANTNIDTLNMSAPPSLVRSGWLHEICTKHCLMDPYRALDPHGMDFTYIPTGDHKNRSRIDFFITGDEMLTRVKKCIIQPHLGTTLFDHKAISLYLNIEKTSTKQFINKCALNYPRTDDVVWAAVADCYLLHAVPDQILPMEREGPWVHHATLARPMPQRLQDQKYKVGTLLRLIQEYNRLVEQRERDGASNFIDLQIAGKNTEIRIHREGMWDIDYLNRLALVPQDDIF